MRRPYEVAMALPSRGGAVTAMKHVGLNVAADPVFTAAYNGVGRGFVIISADDPSMHSSQNEQDNRHYARAAKLPMFEPSDSQDCLAMIREAYDVSERFDIPVLFRLTTRVSHSRSIVEEGEPLVLEPLAYKRVQKVHRLARERDGSPRAAGENEKTRGIRGDMSVPQSMSAAIRWRDQFRGAMMIARESSSRTRLS